MAKQLKGNDSALYIVSDQAIILYEFHQLPATAKWLKFRKIGTCGNIDIMISGKTSKREGSICNIIMNKIQAMGISTREIKLTW